MQTLFVSVSTRPLARHRANLKLFDGRATGVPYITGQLIPTALWV